MFRIILQSLWTQKRSFIGPFVVLLLGFTLLASMGNVVIAANQHAPAGLSPYAANAYKDALSLTSTLMLIVSELCIFVTIFVVANTTSFAITLRLPELALLRLIGATPRQVRRVVRGEMLILALLSAVIGSVLASVGGILFARFLVHMDVAPAGFHAVIQPLVYLVVLAIIVVVSMLGISITALRASRVKPIEAMRLGDVDRRVMNWGRWVLGILFLGAGVGVFLFIPHLHGAGSTALALFVTLIFSISLAALLPSFARPLTRLLTWPLAASTRASGMLAQASFRTNLRRTSSSAAPVMIAVALSVAITGAMASLVATQAQTNQRAISSNFVISTTSDRGLPDSLPATIAGAKPAWVLANRETTLTPSQKPEDGARTVSAVDPDALRALFRLDAASGSLADFSGNAVIMSTQTASGFHWQAGQSIPVNLADGRQTHLRIAALVTNSLTLNDFIVPTTVVADEPDIYIGNVYIRYADAGAAQTATAFLQTTAKQAGATLAPTATYLQQQSTAAAASSRTAAFLYLALAVAFTGIAIANTLAMSTAARLGEARLLRRIGALNKQILGAFIIETVIIVVTGTALGCLAACATLLSTRTALAQTSPDVILAIPWIAGIAVVSGCALLALLATTVPIVSLLRRARSSSTEA